MTFNEKLRIAVNKSESVLCIGLDPDLEKIPTSIKQEFQEPADQMYQFCIDIVESTSLYCAAYKPNLAFFEALGSKGLQVFEKVLKSIPSDKIIIADAKRGDIGNTANHYRKAFFDTWCCDAVTLSPLMGFETVVPFLNDESKGVFVLTLTSNPGSDDFFMQPFRNEPTLSQFISRELSLLDKKYPGHAGMVVGATHLDELYVVLERHRQANLLIPGIGAQGGDLEKLKRVLKDHKGIPLINVSRGILFGTDPDLNHLDGMAIRASEYKRQLSDLSHNYIIQ
jgi:orotidine-5'-phosphate decarboxylase